MNQRSLYLFKAELLVKLLVDFLPVLKLFKAQRLIRRVGLLKVLYLCGVLKIVDFTKLIIEVLLCEYASTFYFLLLSLLSFQNDIGESSPPPVVAINQEILNQ